MPPALILLVGMATILGAIILLRLNAFFALITAAIVVSLLAPGEPAAKIARVAEGFGRTAGTIGVVIALAAITGKAMRTGSSGRSSPFWARSEARRPCAPRATSCRSPCSSTPSSICWSPWPARGTLAPTATISSTSWRLRRALGRRTLWSRPPPDRWRSPARWAWTWEPWSWSAWPWRCPRRGSGCCSPDGWTAACP